MKKYEELDEVYSFKMCPYCSCKQNCNKEYIIKNKSVTSIKCKNYKLSKTKNP